MVHVIYDDREKLPWTADYLGKGFTFTKKRLTEGDYTVKGSTKTFRIERKNSWEEIASAIMTKKGRETFERQMSNLAKFKHRVLIVEDTWHRLKTAPFINDVRTSGQSITRVILPLLIKNQVPLIAAGRRGTKYNRYFVSEVLKIGKEL